MILVTVTDGEKNNVKNNEIKVQIAVNGNFPLMQGTDIGHVRIHCGVYTILYITYFIFCI